MAPSRQLAGRASCLMNLTDMLHHERNALVDSAESIEDTPRGTTIEILSRHRTNCTARSRVSHARHPAPQELSRSFGRSLARSHGLRSFHGASSPSSKFCRCTSHAEQRPRVLQQFDVEKWSKSWQKFPWGTILAVRHLGTLVATHQSDAVFLSSAHSPQELHHLTAQNLNHCHLSNTVMLTQC